MSGIVPMHLALTLLRKTSSEWRQLLWEVAKAALGSGDSGDSCFGEWSQLLWGVTAVALGSGESCVGE